MVSDDVLSERRGIWKSKEVLRRLYFKWYGILSQSLRPGKVLELGGGSGNLKEFLPHAITSDILFEPWLDAVLDAHRLPFKDESLDSIVMFDVLHHLAAPAIFFYEAERVLKAKGRIVMIEPYISWVSFFIYQFLHQEGMNWFRDPLQDSSPGEAKDPFQGNQAIPTLLFERYRKKFEACFPRLDIIKEEKMDFIMYPLSGGFHNPSLCPVFLWNVFEYLERLLQPLNHYLAFRLFVVLEKRDETLSPLYIG